MHAMLRWAAGRPNLTDQRRHVSPTHQFWPRCSGTGSENWLIFYKSKTRNLSLITLDRKINHVISFFIMSALSNLPPIVATACTSNPALGAICPGRLLPSRERDILMVDQTDVVGDVLGCGPARHP